MSTGDLSCGNCGVGHDADDIFCENCGYDFITGSLPSADEGMTPPIIAAAPPMPDGAPLSADGAPPATIEAPAVASATNGAGLPALASKVTFSISVDRDYFDAVVSEGELEFPDPLPAATELELAGTEFHVGRTSDSRAIHPDLDIAELTGDPAVSSRHAVIRVGQDGAVTVTDVGSTNGTFVGAVDSTAIAVGEAAAVDASNPVYVGAWTKLAVVAVEGAVSETPS